MYHTRDGSAYGVSIENPYGHVFKKKKKKKKKKTLDLP
jgi:hypothetical protein